MDKFKAEQRFGESGRTAEGRRATKLRLATNDRAATCAMQPFHIILGEEETRNRSFTHKLSGHVVPFGN